MKLCAIDEELYALMTSAIRTLVQQLEHTLNELYMETYICDLQSYYEAAIQVKHGIMKTPTATGQTTIIFATKKNTFTNNINQHNIRKKEKEFWQMRLHLAAANKQRRQKSGFQFFKESVRLK